ncbi:MAG: hypothetical protein QOH24_2094 [Verrucomicrobiota bacterium]
MKRTVRATIIGIIAAAALVILFAGALLAHDPLVFWNDDYELSILPVCADIARAWAHAEFPLLSPYSWICGNLAGEFQYGVFSVFINSVIIAIWKFSLLFSQQAAALSVVHLAVLSAGGFMLARGRNLSFPFSILVALIAALNGWIICWGATDWFGALGAFAWLPWAWWAAERSLDPARSRWRFLWPAPFVYLVITGGFPYTVLMLLLVFAWLATRNLVEKRDLTGILPLVLGGAIGVGLSAPAWLALLDYIQGSARQTQNPAAHFQWLVPPNAWLGLILPSWTVNWANFSSRMTPHTATELACGLVPPAALISGLITKSRALWRAIRWDLALLTVVAVFAMLPTAGVFRWSFRWLPLFHLVLALSAAQALRSVTEDQQLRRFARPGFVAFVLVIVVAITMQLSGRQGEHAFPLTWIFLAITAGWSCLELWPDRAPLLRAWTPAAVAFVALLGTYLCIPPNCGVPKYNFAQTLQQPAPLDPQRLYFSIYPAPETAYRLEAKSGPVGQTVRPGNASMWGALHFINGYSPIRPAGVAREFASAIHGEIDPNMAAWLLANEAASDRLLDRIGVDGIVVAREFAFAPEPSSEWSLAVTSDEGRVFHRRGAPRPIVRSVNFDGKHAIANVTNIVDSRNRVSVSIDVPAGNAPALIAFSRPFFSGYQAEVGSIKLAAGSFRGLLPVVEVPPGTRACLTLSYRPRWLVWGTAIAVGSALVWITSACFALRMCARRRHQ